MTFRFGIVLGLVCAGLAAVMACGAAEAIPEKGVPAKVLVWVRDSRGAPVAGLTAQDFKVEENGAEARVTEVKPLLAGDGSRADVPVKKSNESRGKAISAPASKFLTHVLLIVPPMAMQGRAFALSGAIRFLQRPEAKGWNVALLDDEGTYIPYGKDNEQVLDALRSLSRHVSAPQYWENPVWLAKATRAIQELGILPGQRAIILPCDWTTEWYYDRNRLYIRPWRLIEDAIAAQAPLYTIQATGPVPVIPTLDALCEYYRGTGECSSGAGLASAISSANTAFGGVRGEFLIAADETGGMAASDIKDAFKHIAGDAAGYYFVSFEAHPIESNGGWHPVSITTCKGFHVKGPHYYLAPPALVPQEMEARVKLALVSAKEPSPVHVSAHTWLFPAHGPAHAGAFAAEVSWSGEDEPLAVGSRVRIYGDIVDEGTSVLNAVWYEEREWPAQGALPVHWQREGHLYPGSYQLRVVAMDVASGRTGVSIFPFAVRPLQGAALRFSALVLANECLPVSEQAKLRRSLFDPLLWEGCKYAPQAEAMFHADQDVRLLLRMYPPNAKFAQLVLQKWSAYAVIDDADAKAIPLAIAEDAPRGLVIAGTLPLPALKLQPGKHRLTLLLRLEKDSSAKKWIPFHAEFAIGP